MTRRVEVEPKLDERETKRDLVRKFRDVDPQAFEYLVSTRSLQIGWEIDFETDELSGELGWVSTQRAGLVGASMSQINSWTDGRRQDARRVLSLLTELYPG